MGKTTRNAISNDQKREICQYKKDNPRAKNVEIISHFEKKFNRQFGRSTMTEILQNSTLYLTNFNSNNEFRLRKAAHPELNVLSIDFLKFPRLMKLFVQITNIQ